MSENGKTPAEVAANYVEDNIAGIIPEHEQLLYKYIVALETFLGVSGTDTAARAQKLIAGETFQEVQEQVGEVSRHPQAAFFNALALGVHQIMSNNHRA
jgi:hypothetical protein